MIARPCLRDRGGDVRDEIRVVADECGRISIKPVDPLEQHGLLGEQHRRVGSEDQGVAIEADARRIASHGDGGPGSAGAIGRRADEFHTVETGRKPVERCAQFGRADRLAEEIGDDREALIVVGTAAGRGASIEAIDLLAGSCFRSGSQSLLRVSSAGYHADGPS